MPEAGVILFFLAGTCFAGLIGLVIWLGWYFAKKRREALAALARELGLSFSAADPFAGTTYGRSRGFLAGIFGSGRAGIPGRFGQFGALSVGDSRRGYNVLHGELRGREVAAFDYRYCTGSGKNRHTHHLSAAVFTFDCRFPELVIRPENFFDKLAGVIGFEDIDFESDEFSRRFHVKGRDRKFAYDVIHQKAMEYLLRCSGWSIEMDGADVMIWTGKRWDPAGFKSAISVLEGFLELVPDYLWKDLRVK